MPRGGSRKKRKRGGGGGGDRATLGLRQILLGVHEILPQVRIRGRNLHYLLGAEQALQLLDCLFITLLHDSSFNLSQSRACARWGLWPL